MIKTKKFCHCVRHCVICIEQAEIKGIADETKTNGIFYTFNSDALEDNLKNCSTTLDDLVTSAGATTDYTDFILDTDNNNV